MLKLKNKNKNSEIQKQTNNKKKNLTRNQIEIARAQRAWYLHIALEGKITQDKL